MKTSVAICWIVLALPAAAQTPAAGTIRGTVVDARDGRGIGKVSVRLQDTQRAVTTDDQGRFELIDVLPGIHELYVSTVDFGLAKVSVTVEAGQVASVSVALTGGAGPYTESVTVRGEPATRREPTVAAEHTLGRQELSQLRGVLTNDPMRAIQVLPGVATGDDFRSEFSVRGLGIGQMNFTFEGISTAFLVHTVQQVRETGSLAMVNGDVLDEVTLLSGAYPQRHGNRIGAELDFRMREGSREGRQSHVAVSAVDAAAVIEGPLGTGARGSWLASARRSYLDLVVARLYPEQELAFGFTDAQAKLVSDVAPHHQLQFAVTGGRSRLDRQIDTLGAGDLRFGDNASGVAVFTWRYTPSAAVTVAQRVAFAANDFRNTTRDGVDLDHGRAQDVVYRTDASIAAGDRLMIEAGGEARASTASLFDQRLSGSKFVTRDEFSGSGVAASVYAQARLTSVRGLSVVPGLRIDRRALTGRTELSPWVTGLWPLGRWLTARAGTGVYRQDPGFDEIAGLRGTPSVRSQRSYDVDAGVEGRIGPAARWQVTMYSRQDRDLLRLADAEPHLANGALVNASTTSRYANALNGRSRGVELLLERRSPNGLSGWASYAFGDTRYRDATTGEAFPGDFDQRHTVNVYGVYRVSDRFSVSAKFRAGSNFPAPGYWREQGAFFLSAERNQLRIPPYSRLDVRANRVFAWKQRRLTLFLEGLNVTARRNVRVGIPSVNRRTLEVTRLFETLAPFVPSAGILLEF